MNLKIFESKYGNIRFIQSKDVFYNAEDVAKILGFYNETDYIKILLKYISATLIKTIGTMLFIDSLGLELLMSRTSTKKGIKFREWYLNEFIKTLKNPITNNYRITDKKEDNKKD